MPNMRLRAAIILLPVLGLGAVAPADPPPTMEQLCPPSVNISNYDGDYFHVGEEMLIQYVIKNTSPVGDQYNMVEFSVPVGIENANVLKDVMELPGLKTNWTIAVYPNSTSFQGLLKPGANTVFEVYFALSPDYLDVFDFGYRPATAIANGPPYPGRSFTPVPVLVPVVPIWGDEDRDGDVDAADAAEFAACATGPAVPYPPESATVHGRACAMFDADGDADIDQRDFGVFQTCVSGDGNLSDCQTAAPYPPSAD